MSLVAVQQKGVEVEHLEELSFVRKYIFSSDHKTIAKQYLGISLFMATVGGFTAYAIRWQLAWPSARIPGMGVITSDAYNTLVTMHGTIMVFFVAMPLLLGVFGNFCIPLMVGPATWPSRGSTCCRCGRSSPAP
jgi:cytochrome c oxidase subunit 1